MRPLAGLLVALILLGSAPAWAQGQVRERVRNGEVQPLDRILPQIREGYPGEFYNAEGPFPGPDGQLHYRIKWLTPDGFVVWFDANARSGRILGIVGGPPRAYAFPPRGPYGPPGLRPPGRVFGRPWGGGWHGAYGGGRGGRGRHGR